MEKSEKHRIKDKPKLSLIDKGKGKVKGNTIKKNSIASDVATIENQRVPKNSIIKINQGNNINNAAPIIQSAYPQQINSYAVPIMMNSPGQIINPNPNTYIYNQMSPNIVYVNKKDNDSSDINVSVEPPCPYCNSDAPGQHKESFNCCTCFTYAICIPIVIFAACFSGCDGATCSCDCDCKCCIDIDSYCPNCGKKIKTVKNSWIELCPWFEKCFNC